MKIFKVSAIAIISLFLLVGFASMAISAPETKTPAKATNVQTTKPPVATATCCPAGWHITAGDCTGRFVCSPNKPAPIKCPGSGGKYSYFDNGCTVGCQEVVK